MNVNFTTSIRGNPSNALLIEIADSTERTASKLVALADFESM